jgi:hypothetical protein
MRRRPSRRRSGLFDPYDVRNRHHFSGGDANVLWIPPGWSSLTLLVRGAAGPEAPELRVLRLESAD